MYNLIKIMYKNLFAAKRLEPVLFLIITIALIQHASEVYSQDLTKSELLAELDRLAEQTEDKVIKWRRDIHQHPELSNREYRTSKLVAEHLQSLGMEVRTEIAHTGVVAILRGNNLSPLVALRADMDALPVTEEVDVPFASKVRTEYNGQEVGVMHACGHDCHTAMLMGVAEILSTMRNHLPGSVKFIFQPAEEGAPPGEEGGAALMIREGAFENYHTDVIFGQHIITDFEVGTIGYKQGGTMASVDGLDITVHRAQEPRAVCVL